MTHFSLGVSLIFYREDYDESLLRDLNSAGIQTLEVNSRQLGLPRQRETARSLFSRQSPRVSSLHALFGPEFDISRLEPEVWQNAIHHTLEAVETATELDIPLIVMHPSSEPILNEDRQRRLDRCLEGFTRIGQKAKSSGRRIAIEYLPRTCLGNCLEELNWLVDRLGDETFGVCLDVNHLMGRYAELPQVVLSLGKRLIATHISDCDEVDEKHWLPGKGVLDWRGFMQALVQIDYPGPFTYECDVEGNTLPEKLSTLAENFTWLNSLID